MQQPIKTRIAPTPSGYLHLGNALAFSFTYLYARLHGLKILLRIDDGDQARYRDAYAAGIFKTLEALGIAWDDGPGTVSELKQSWSQRHRQELYQQALDQLVARDALFACTCSRKDWQENFSGYPGWCLAKNHSLLETGVAWRFKPQPKGLEFKNLKQLREWHPWPEQMNHFVVLQKNGQVAYQLSSLVDDLHFGVTHVIRGADLLPSTLAQLALAQHFGVPFEQRLFHHHPLWAPQGQKLSKSQKAPPVLDLLGTSGGRQKFMHTLGQWLGFKNQYPNLEAALKALQEEREVLI